VSATKAELTNKLNTFLSDPAARVDPYPFYRDIRENDPVHQGADGTWWITDYEGCLHLTRDRRWSHQNPHAGKPTSPSARPPGRARTMISRMLLFRDAPDHSRLRGLLGRVFSKPSAERNRTRFRAHIDELLNRIEPGKTVEFREQIARLIPIHMICDVIGLPQERYSDLVNWTNSYASMLAVEIPEEVEKRADEDFAAFSDYIAPIVAERTAHPQEDLISEWVKAHAAGKLEMDEIASFALFTLTGGQTTTTLLMANGLYTLLRHPDQWQQLIADRSLKASAVEEILRFESSGRALVPRWAKEDIELSGKRIRQGDMAIGIESAANRDPKYFTDPERFDIRRGDNPHLSFGGGVHVCPGQFVARVEAQELFAALAERFPTIEFVQEPQWLPEWIVRGMQSLHVRVPPAKN
jgi:cytochrome P450